MYSLTELIYEPINDQFAKARYGSFDVIIMKKNSYINVTRLCEMALTKTGEPKRFKQWKELKSSEELIDEVSLSAGIPADKLINEFLIGGRVSKNLIECKGTYAHPDLVPHIAMWASTKFAIKVFFFKKFLIY